MLLKILTWIGIATAAAVLVPLSSALLDRGYRQHSLSQAAAIRSTTGIDRLERVTIDGIYQWIEVRGNDESNPILLFIHGGPGVAFIPLSHSFQRDRESHFTVVQWDQREPEKPTRPMLTRFSATP